MLEVSLLNTGSEHKASTVKRKRMGPTNYKYKDSLYQIEKNGTNKSHIQRFTTPKDLEAIKMGAIKDE